MTGTFTEWVTRDVVMGMCALLLIAEPEVVPEPDRVILDRQQNRHLAFGAGIHRCADSNLARMELRVAVEEWLARMPDFDVTDPADVTWAGGQVRGPRSIPVRIG